MLSRPYVSLTSFKKPMMITEFGTLSAGGDPRAWITGAHVAIEKRYPEIHAIVLFNQTHDDTLGGGALNWSPMAALPGSVQLLSAWMASGQNR